MFENIVTFKESGTVKVKFYKYPKMITEETIDEEIQEDEPKKSLLKSVFSSKKIKEEVSWVLHCVKSDDTYEKISEKYKVNLNKLKSINNNEVLNEGKLIFLPLE